MRRRLLSAIALCLVGCYPAEVTLVGTTESKSFGAAPTQSRGISDARLATVAGDVRRLEYVASERHRVFLMTPGLDTAASSGFVLQMPQPPNDAGVRIETVPSPNAWHSARAYDIGLCGELGTFEALASAIADGFDTELAKQASGVSRVSASITPRYRQANNTFDDTFHFAGRWNVQSIGGCTNTFVQMNFDFAINKTTGTRKVLRSTRPPSAACSTVPTGPDGVTETLSADAGVFDFVATVLPEKSPAVFVDIGDVCFSEPSIRGALEGGVKAGFPRAFADGLKAATTVPVLGGAVAGVPIVTCSCDRDCTATALGVGGPRHRCVSGLCAVQLEADRIESRPDGLNVVLADSERDVQAGFFIRDGGSAFSPRGRFCDPTRSTVTSPTLSTLPGAVAAE